MKKIYTALFLTVFSISVLYAGMEQTRECNNRIRAFEAEINSLQNQLNEIQGKIKTLSEESAYHQKTRDDFAKLPLIPDMIRQWKKSSFEEKIAKLETSISSCNTDKQRIENNILTQQQNLEVEKRRLQSYKTITLRKISIDAYGNWDTFAGPEIRVKMGDSVIAKGNQDSSHLSSDLFEDATNFDKLHVFDEDMTEWEYMGAIPLNKHEIPLGIPGDTGSKTVQGRIGSSCAFDYVLIYEVEY